jgi:hypothetical protein
MSNKQKYKSTQSAQNQEHKNSAGGNTQAANSCYPKDYPLVPLRDAVKDLEEAYAAAQKENDTYQRKQLTTQRVLCIIAFMTFIAAAIYAGISYNQWMDLRHNFEITERAWLFPEETGVNVIGGHPTVHVGFRNTGHTPSFDTEALECSEVRTTEPIGGPQAKPNSCRAVHWGIVGPNVFMRSDLADFSSVMNADIALRFSKKELRLYYWGRLSYKSLPATEAKSPFTQFCLMSETVPAKPGSPVPYVLAPQLAPCPHGQDAK